MKSFKKMHVYWDISHQPAEYTGRWKADIECVDDEGIEWLLHGFGTTIIDAVSDAWGAYERGDWKDYGAPSHIPHPEYPNYDE